MALSSSLISAPNYMYDVFPSFHGDDVRKGFHSHLHKEFERKNITMFDEPWTERREVMTPSLIKAIRESRISIVTISQNYASSSWCLDKLVEIMECNETRGQIVIPIYYGVDPSDVQKRMGEFGKAFNETCARKTEEERQKWINALKQVTNIIAGYDSFNWINEAEIVVEIANAVLNRLNRTVPPPLLDSKTDEVEMAEISRPSSILPIFANIHVLYTHVC